MDALYEEARQAIVALDTAAVERILEAHPELARMRSPGDGGADRTHGRARRSRWKPERRARDPFKAGDDAFVLADALVGAARLLDRGADPSARDHFGMTAMHYAVQGNAELLEILVARGADAKVRDDRFNATPYGWARYQGHEDSVRYLEEHSELDPGDRAQERRCVLSSLDAIDRRGPRIRTEKAMSEEKRHMSEEELEQVHGGKAMSRRSMDEEYVEDDVDAPTGDEPSDIWDPPVE